MRAGSLTIEHVVGEDETAWFLAQLYYGQGAQYPKLLKSNGLQRAEDLKPGLEIRVENAVYHKNQPDFARRYSRLWEQRQKALGLKVGSKLPHSQVVIPTETIRDRDQTPTLPFSGKSPAKNSESEIGKEELRENSRTSNQGD